MHKIQVASLTERLLAFLRYILLPTCFMLLLSSCSHVRRDGPPDFYVDETKIPNAKPKVEPRAKLGNMNCYRVKGRTYHVMKSSKNYDEIGTASWYGTLFHGQRASDGERYNMLAMTAAHKTLPLPTYVEVTNLHNHKKIIVKVNDRGPFRNDRLIDLSYVAAKKLGMIGHGTATVEVKAIDPITYGQHIQLATNTTSRHRHCSAKKLKVISRSKRRGMNLKYKTIGMKSDKFGRDDNSPGRAKNS